jgi:hypothetical protein
VEDHTEVKGEFDFELDWDRDDAPNALGPLLASPVPCEIADEKSGS